MRKWFLGLAALACLGMVCEDASASSWRGRRGRNGNRNHGRNFNNNGNRNRNDNGNRNRNDNDNVNWNTNVNDTFNQNTNVNTVDVGVRVRFNRNFGGW